MRETRLPEGVTEFDPRWYERARAEMAKLPRYSTRLGREIRRGESATPEAVSWQPVGPSEIGGRVRALLVDPRNPRVLYAAGVSGGIWKSTNRAASWRSVSGELANLGVTALAFDPKDSRVIYAGTGEGFISGPQGLGIYRSTDAGEHWTVLPRPPAAAGESRPSYIHDLVVSATGKRLYAATDEGVFRVTPDGKKWTLIFAPDTQGGCHDLALRPQLTATVSPHDFLVAACGARDLAIVARNERAQAAASPWVQVLGEPGLSRTTLAFAPSSPNVLYALSSHVRDIGIDPVIRQPNNSLHAVYRSDQAGAPGSWTARVHWQQPDPTRPLNPLLLSYALVATASSCGAGLPSDEAIFGQGWYANVLAVDPLNPDRLFAGGIDIYRSDDGGRSWGIASHWWPHTGNSLPQSPAYAHADQHALVFDPAYDGTTNRRLYAGNDGGVFATDDALAQTGTARRAGCDPSLTQVKWKALNRGLAITQFYRGVSFGGARRFWGGTQDNGSLLGDLTQTGRRWRQILGGDGWYTAVASGSGGDVLLGQDTGNGLLRSVDGGVTFQIAGQEVFAAQEPGLKLGAPLVVDPNDRRRVWLGTWERPWRSEDAGATWKPASKKNTGPVPDWPIFRTIAVAPLESNRVLLGSGDGEIWASSNATQANDTTVWTRVEPRRGNVADVAWDPRSTSVAYAVYSTFEGAHLWKTVDAGVSWNPLGVAILPNVPLLAVAVDPVAGRLYVGTDLGLLVSLDGGNTWAVEESGFAPVITPSLHLDQEPNGDRYLFAFTHGRGAWRVKLE